MKKVIVLILLVIAASGMEAQKWWYSVEHCIVPGYCEYSPMILEVDGDTLINGITCAKLKKSRTTCSDVYNEYIYSYIYYDSTKVFQFNRFLNDFILIYDFSANIGDSLKVISSTYSNTDTCHNLYKVTTIDSVSINNHWLPLLNGKIFNQEILGRIGYLNKYFLPEPCGSEGGVAVSCFDYILANLRCYEDSTLGLFRRWDSIPCDTIYTVSRTHVYNLKSNNEEIAISPNPMSNKLSIENIANISNLYIYDIKGRLLRKFYGIKEHASLDVSYLKEGIYILNIEDLITGKLWHKKIVKQ
ncbi:MAG TPA: T9SS type A sorting domain-containing protein [Chitinophagales bacterium]|nr:T9SS type A sorting domain-containing protein [Chitinophagales bacterium]